MESGFAAADFGGVIPYTAGSRLGPKKTQNNLGAIPFAPRCPAGSGQLLLCSCVVSSWPCRVIGGAIFSVRPLQQLRHMAHLKTRGPRRRADRWPLPPPPAVADLGLLGLGSRQRPRPPVSLSTSSGDSGREIFPLRSRRRALGLRLTGFLSWRGTPSAHPMRAMRYALMSPLSLKRFD